jgi:hypothetical protein
MPDRGGPPSPTHAIGTNKGPGGLNFFFSYSIVTARVTHSAH